MPPIATATRAQSPPRVRDKYACAHHRPESSAAAAGHLTSSLPPLTRESKPVRHAAGIHLQGTPHQAGGSHARLHESAIPRQDRRTPCPRVMPKRRWLTTAHDRDPRLPMPRLPTVASHQQITRTPHPRAREAAMTTVVNVEADTCDACGVPAYLYAEMREGRSLAYCCHHGTEFLPELMRQATAIIDLRYMVG